MKQRDWTLIRHEAKMYTKATGYVLFVISLIYGITQVVMWLSKNYPGGVVLICSTIVFAVVIRLVRNNLDE